MSARDPRLLRRWHFPQLTLFVAVWMLLAPSLRDRWLVQVALQLVLLNAVLVTLWSNPDWLRYRNRVLILWAVSAAGALLERLPLPGRWAVAVFVVEVLSLLPVMALVAVGMLRYVYRSHRLTMDGIFATVVVYVLIALMFARAYLLLIGLDRGSFALPVPAADRAPHLLETDLLYFSLVTLATVGYGDILPVSDTARMLAMIEAIVGQFYIAVVVAVFVGMYAAQRRD